jgi:hypothetical protein
VPRAIVLTVTLSVLATACGLVEPPPPAGTRMIEAEVRNLTPRPLQPGVATPTGDLAGSAQPASLLPGATSRVTFYGPMQGDWTIVLDSRERIPKSEFEEYLAGL